MTRTTLTLIVLILVVLATAGGTAASTALAGGGVTALIKDASDGVVDGTYGAAVVRSALAVVRGDPAYAMYSDIEGVLVDYLASITGSGGGTPDPADPSTPTPSATTSSGDKSTAKATPHAKGSPQRVDDADALDRAGSRRRRAFSAAQRHRVGPGQVAPRRRAVALRPPGRRDRRRGGAPAPAPLVVAGAAPPHQVSYRSDPLRYSLTCSPSPSAMVMMRHAISSTLVSW